MSPQANIVGNVYDKYESKNPIARLLMSGFMRAVTDLYRSVGANSVLEVGCGEGRLADQLIRVGKRPQRFHAVDLSLDHIAGGLDEGIEFSEASIYELPYQDDEFELVVCCEVLEHLEDPRAGLAELARVAKNAVLLSTPWEPVWRTMNMARGKYWSDLGNTPGHIQHFSRRGLTELASRKLKIRTKRRPLPWTVLLGEPLN